MELLDLKNNNILPFKFKRLKSGKYFLVNDVGEWLIMDENEFKNFIEGEVPQNKHEELIEKSFIKGNNSKKEVIKDLAAKRIMRHHYMLHGPVLHIMVLTLSCNHSCCYCHASAKMTGGEKYHLTEDYARKIVDTIFQTTSGSINIEFQGGEPLANRNVLKFIIEYAREKNQEKNLNLDFSLVSNLTLMDEEKLDYLIAEDINISTSIDGPKEVHDENRKISGGGSSFEEVVYWLQRINEKIEERGLNNKAGAIVTVTRKALDYPKAIVDTYLSLGLNKIFLRPLNPYGFASEIWDRIGYTAEEYNSFYKEYLFYVREKQKEGYEIMDAYSDDIYFNNFVSTERMNYMEERTPCGATLGQVAYDWTGKIYSCDEGRMLAAGGDESFKIGEIDFNKTSDQIYKEMILNNVTKMLVYSSIIDYIPGYDTNPSSKFIGVCPIYSYTTQGNVVSKYKKEDRFNIQENMLDNLIE